MKRKKDILARNISSDCSGEGYCVAEEIFAEIENIIKTCTEEEYSREYGFAARSWFNITKFRNKLARLKKKYERNKKE